MVEKVASVNNNTVVIVNSVGPIIMDVWIENPNGAPCLSFLFANTDWGVYTPSSHCCGKLEPYTKPSSLVNRILQIWAGLPGQEAGNAITDVLYGDVNPRSAILLLFSCVTHTYRQGMSQRQAAFHHHEERDRLLRACHLHRFRHRADPIF